VEQFIENAPDSEIVTLKKQSERLKAAYGSGSAEEMRFLAPSANALIRAGRARIELKRVEQRGHFALAASETPELASNGTPDSEILLDGLESIAFSYFGSDKPGDPPRWQESWENRTRLPQLVRLPDPLRASYGRLMARNGPDFFTERFRKGLPTSVDELE